MKGSKTSISYIIRPARMLALLSIICVAKSLAFTIARQPCCHLLQKPGLAMSLSRSGSTRPSSNLYYKQREDEDENGFIAAIDSSRLGGPQGQEQERNHNDNIDSSMDVMSAGSELQLQQPSMIKHLYTISRNKILQTLFPRSLSTSDQSTSTTQVGQKNTNRSWMYMAIYWTIGAAVSVAFGYKPSSWNAIASPFTSLHAVSMAINLSLAKLFFDSCTNFDRPRGWRSTLASFIMAAFNGTFETVLMLATYDLGAVWLNSIFSGTSAAAPAADALTAKAAALGILTNYCYGGLIHVFFWLPKALPPHRHPDAKPFYVRGLPEVSFLSLTWLAVYVFTKDVAFICVLHFLFNLHGGLVMGLQLPSLRQKGRDSEQW